MKLLIATALVMTVALGMAYAEYVSGYVDSQGRWHNGYYRSDANNTTSDNYSHKGNYNPYTGKRGTQDDDNYSKPKKNSLFGD